MLAELIEGVRDLHDTDNYSPTHHHVVQLSLRPKVDPLTGSRVPGTRVYVVRISNGGNDRFVEGVSEAGYDEAASDAHRRWLAMLERQV